MRKAEVSARDPPAWRERALTSTGSQAGEQPLRPVKDGDPTQRVSACVSARSEDRGRRPARTLRQLVARAGHGIDRARDRAGWTKNHSVLGDWLRQTSIAGEVARDTGVLVPWSCTIKMRVCAWVARVCALMIDETGRTGLSRVQGMTMPNRTHDS